MKYGCILCVMDLKLWVKINKTSSFYLESFFFWVIFFIICFTILYLIIFNVLMMIQFFLSVCCSFIIFTGQPPDYFYDCFYSLERFPHTRKFIIFPVFTPHFVRLLCMLFLYRLEKVLKFFNIFFLLSSYYWGVFNIQINAIYIYIQLNLKNSI